MINEEKFEIALIQARITKNELASRLSISREALRRRVKTGNFTIHDVVIMREIFGKETADGFLF